MKVAVLGAGVIGIATAYYLRERGHEVVVVDRQSEAGRETSFGNAGDICPSYATPWAAPGMRMKALKWLFDRNAPAKLNFRADAALWRWILTWLGNCDEAHYQINKPRMQRIAGYSLRCLQDMRQRERLEYDHTAGGWTQVFRTQAGIDAAQSAIRILQAANIPHRLLDAAALLEVDPGLAHASAPLAGGLHFPMDETGDCHKFTQALATLLAARGVEFRYDTIVTRIETEGDAIRRVHTDRAPVEATAYVVALGVASVALLRPLSITLPIQPVKGYSITVPIVDFAMAPRTAIVDEQYKVAVTRMGNRLRAAGTAELGARNVDAPATRCATLLKVIQDLYPRGIDTAAPSRWAGLRPMTPDGPPILGPSRYVNLFLNVGHGSNGWTQACGSGRVASDLVSGRAPEIDLAGLTIERYRSS